MLILGLGLAFCLHSSRLTFRMCNVMYADPRRCFRCSAGALGYAMVLVKKEKMLAAFTYILRTAEMITVHS